MILRQSQVPHAWRITFAYLSLSVWLTIGLYLLIAGPVGWLIHAGFWGSFDWTFGPISG